MSELFKLFDELNDQIYAASSLGVIAADGILEDYSREITQGYMSTLVEKLHNASMLSDQIQKQFSDKPNSVETH